jgi:hypothetical protein
LLLYAAERLDNPDLRREALSLLRKHSRRAPAGWPGAIAPFLLRKFDAAGLEAQVKATRNETLAGRRRCQADFYIALGALRDGDRRLFRAGMARCAESPYGHLEHEHYLARWEVEQDFPEPAFTQA